MPPDQLLPCLLKLKHPQSTPFTSCFSVVANASHYDTDALVLLRVGNTVKALLGVNWWPLRCSALRSQNCASLRKVTKSNARYQSISIISTGLDSKKLRKLRMVTTLANFQPMPMHWVQFLPVMKWWLAYNNTMWRPIKRPHGHENELCNSAKVNVLVCDRLAARYLKQMQHGPWAPPHTPLHPRSLPIAITIRGNNESHHSHYTKRLHDKSWSTSRIGWSVTQEFQWSAQTYAIIDCWRELSKVAKKAPLANLVTWSKMMHNWQPLAGPPSSSYMSTLSWTNSRWLNVLAVLTS